MKNLFLVLVIVFAGMTANAQDYAMVDNSNVINKIDVNEKMHSNDNISSEIKKMKEEILIFAKNHISEYTNYKPKNLAVSYILKTKYRMVWYVTFNSKDDKNIIFRGNRRNNGLNSGVIEVSSFNLKKGEIIFQQK